MSLLSLIEQANTKPTFSSKHYESVDRRKDMTGEVFGDLTVVKGFHTSSKDNVECMCKCGNRVKRSVRSLRRGDMKSCGCDNGIKFKVASEHSSSVIKKYGDDIRPKIASRSELAKMYRNMGIPKR